MISKKKLIFHLKRFWEVDGKTVDLYQEIKAGRKTSEWRDMTDYWSKRLIQDYETVALIISTEDIEECKATGKPMDLTKYLKAKEAWFVVGYPRYCISRLEAKITKLLAWFCEHPKQSQYEIQFTEVQEVVLKSL